MLSKTKFAFQFSALNFLIFACCAFDANAQLNERWFREVENGVGTSDTYGNSIAVNDNESRIYFTGAHDKLGLESLPLLGNDALRIPTKTGQIFGAFSCDGLDVCPTVWMRTCNPGQNPSIGAGGTGFAVAAGPNDQAIVVGQAGWANPMSNPIVSLQMSRRVFDNCSPIAEACTNQCGTSTSDQMIGTGVAYGNSKFYIVGWFDDDSFVASFNSTNFAPIECKMIANFRANDVAFDPEDNSVFVVGTNPATEDHFLNKYDEDLNLEFSYEPPMFDNTGRGCAVAVAADFVYIVTTNGQDPTFGQGPGTYVHKLFKLDVGANFQRFGCFEYDVVGANSTCDGVDANEAPIWAAGYDIAVRSGVLMDKIYVVGMRSRGIKGSTDPFTLGYILRLESPTLSSSLNFVDTTLVGVGKGPGGEDETTQLSGVALGNGLNPNVYVTGGLGVNLPGVASCGMFNPEFTQSESSGVDMFVAKYSNTRVCSQ